jgi:hypothetical protein
MNDVADIGGHVSLTGEAVVALVGPPKNRKLLNSFLFQVEVIHRVMA